MARFYNRTSEKPRRQLLCRETPKAEEVLWVDFYCPTARLAIEIDGDSDFQKGSAVREETRQTVIESFGILVLRFRNGEVFEHLTGALAAIERHLLELMAKRTPLKSPLVQGGTFEGSKEKW